MIRVEAPSKSKLKNKKYYEKNHLSREVQEH